MSVRKRSPGGEVVREDELSEHQTSGWRAVSAVGLQVKGSRKRNVSYFHRHRHNKLEVARSYIRCKYQSSNKLMQTTALNETHTACGRRHRPMDTSEKLDMSLDDLVQVSGKRGYVSMPFGSRTKCTSDLLFYLLREKGTSGGSCLLAGPSF